MEKKLRIATRASPLALAQVDIVARRISAHREYPYQCDILPHNTMGDRITDKPLSEIGGKALFTRTLEESLSRGEADLAVHSLKDVAEVADEFTLAAFLDAADCRDVFVPAPAYRHSALAQLPPDSIIGTSSPRRCALLRHYYPTLTTEMIRGNIQTRLDKCRDGGFAGIILAAAGLHRLGLESVIGEYLPADSFLPAIGQGILVVQTRADDAEMLALAEAISEPQVAQRARIYRAFLAAIGGDCHTATGGYAYPRDSRWVFQAFLSVDDEVRFITRESERGSEELGVALARDLLGA